jgi:hypothetical protein
MKTEGKRMKTRRTPIERGVQRDAAAARRLAVLVR